MDENVMAIRGDDMGKKLRLVTEAEDEHYV
jgi:hypothetical protein